MTMTLSFGRDHAPFSRAVILINSAHGTEPFMARPIYGLPGGAGAGQPDLCRPGPVAGGLAIGAPDAARWAGVALLAGIGAVALLFLYRGLAAREHGCADARGWRRRGRARMSPGR